MNADDAQLVGCAFGPGTDFNGDGLTDIAITDPEATVDGTAHAGRVHIVYGGNEGTRTISQASSFVPTDVQPGERFGHALAVYDANVDGCDDLVVTAPYEDVDGETDSGAVFVINGAPGGLGQGQVTFITETSANYVVHAEDHFGFSVAAGNDLTGNPYLAIGVPDRSIGAEANAGMVVYSWTAPTHGTVQTTLMQDHTTPAAVETDDRFGYAIAADAAHIAIGVPYEDVGTEADAGTVHVYGHGDTPPQRHSVPTGAPLHEAMLNQEGAGQSGVAEAGDLLGWSVGAQVFTTGEAVRKSLIAAGSPGEAHGDLARAGRVVTVAAETDGEVVTELTSISQHDANVEGASETGDEFGSALALTNRRPGQPAAWNDLLVAVGIPGEDIETVTDTGAVRVFSALGPAGDHDVALDLSSQEGSQWSQKIGARLGECLDASTSVLHVGDPDGTRAAAYSVPWVNLTDGGADPPRVFVPGRDGIPTSGVGHFGTSII